MEHTYSIKKSLAWIFQTLKITLNVCVGHQMCFFFICFFTSKNILPYFLVKIRAETHICYRSVFIAARFQKRNEIYE
jgi:hypothetical protein